MVAEALWLTEVDVVELVDLPTAIEAVEGAFRSEAMGTTSNMSKTHLVWGEGDTLHAIGAVDGAQNLVATKTWAHTTGGAAPLLIVWDARSGALEAVIECFALGQLRTGAVSGVATRYLSSTDAHQLAIIGSGRQALAQVAAVASVRDITHVRVHSPNQTNREAFAARVNALDLGVEVAAVSSVEEAVFDAQIVSTVTRAREPFLHASLLSAGTHVNAVGAITPERRELAADVVEQADLVAADDPSAARSLAAELEGVSDIVRLCDLVLAGNADARPAGVTVFKAMGVGLADLALGAHALARARSTGSGRHIPAPQRAAPHLKEN